jgi:hypothetical protein
MHRITSVAAVILVQFALASPAMGATISITPERGPAGTVVSFQGAASECAQRAAADAEVSLDGDALDTPRQPVDLGDAGTFAGTITMPDPGTATSAALRVRCLDDAGQPDPGDITPTPATFTYAHAPGERPAACASLAGMPSDAAIEAILAELDSCLQVVLRGNPLANAIVGNVLANVIEGFSGDDVLRGLAGNDTIRGGPGNDRLFGDAGSDAVVGGAGHDMLQGGAGGDTINANDRTGGDVVVGGAGPDTCAVNRGDTVRGCERVLVR